MKHVEIIENGKVVICPVCKDDNIVSVHPFDYVKQCENPRCPYHLKHPKKWKYQFTTGVHN